MNITDPILHTALLGTANKSLSPGELPPALDQLLRNQQTQNQDAETTWYQLAALTFAYQQAGLEPIADGHPVTPVEEAPEDTLPYFAEAIGEWFVQLLARPYLLLYAYRQAGKCGKLIPPTYLPRLIAHAFENNQSSKSTEQALLAPLCGFRGQWLLKHMKLPQWGTTDPANWETATHSERLRLLSERRKQAPAEGLALLQTEFNNETAQHRNELIGCLAIGLSIADEAFLLEVLQTDRSKAVKETAQQLLCSLPDSEIVKTYCRLLHEKLHHSLFWKWSYNEISFTPELEALGLEAVSPNKNEKDSEFLLRQLAERVPLSFWAECYGCTPEKAALKLAKKPPFEGFFNLCKPILTFKDSLWAYHTISATHNGNYLYQLLGLLTPAQREDFSLSNLPKRFPLLPPDWFHEDEAEWGLRFSQEVVKYLCAHSPYGEITERLSPYLPTALLPFLHRQVASVPQPSHQASLCQELIECLEIKEKINTLLHANQAS